MPRVPEYNEQFRYMGRAAGMNARMTPGDFSGTAVAIGAGGQAQGRQLEQAGKAVQKVATDMAYIYDDYNTTKAQSALNALQSEFLGWQSETAKKKGKDAMNAGADYAQWSKTRVSELTKDMNPIQRGRFEGMAAQRLASQRSWAEGYGSEQGVVYRNAEDMAGIETEKGVLAANLANKEMAEASIMRIKDLSFTIAMRKGLGDEATKILMRDSVASAIAPAIMAQVEAGKLGDARSSLQSYRIAIGEQNALKLEGAIKREAKRQEAEARAAAALVRMEARQLASLAPDQLSYALQTGDFGAVEKTAAELNRIGAHDQAAELTKSINLQKDSAAITQSLKGVPFVDALAEVNKAFGKGGVLLPDNARAVKTIRDSARGQIEKNAKAFINDPAAYAAQIQPQDKDVPLQEQITRSLEMQRELGKELNFTPQVLTKKQQLTIKNQFDAAKDGTQRMKMIRDLQQETGKFFPQLTREAGLPAAVVSLSPALPHLTDKAGGALLTASVFKWSELPDGEQRKKEALATADTSKVVNMFTGLRKAFPFNEAVARQATQFRDSLSKAVHLGMDVDDIDKSFHVLNDSGMYLAIPKDAQLNLRDVENVLTYAREDIRKNLEDMGAMPKDAQNNGVLSRLWKSNAARAAENGVWVSSPDYKGFDLIDTANGKILHHVPYTDMPALKEKYMRQQMEAIGEEGL